MALLLLAVEWAAGRDVTLEAVTVDHGLRPEATEEAAFVARCCEGLGVAHTTLTWQGRTAAGNLQDRARAARYQMIADWAEERGIETVLMAHTVEDQAETFLMRLARASGVDGLSAMTARKVGNATFRRPLLGCHRDALRGYLSDRGQTWVEDPSNTDEKYDRVKIRARMDGLGELGMNADTLAEVAANLGQARDALNWAIHKFAQSHVQLVGPDLTIEAAAYSTLPQELQRRLLVWALRWVSGADYAPRRGPVAALMQAIMENTPMTLHGCRVTHRKGRIWVFRELSAVQTEQCAPGQVWDGRWRLTGPAQDGDVIAALGANGQAQLHAWRDTGRPAASVQADPGVWRNGTLIAAPLSGWGNGWQGNSADPDIDYLSALLSH